MKYTIQYVPLKKLKPGVSSKSTKQAKQLRSVMWDCMHLLVVRKNKKDGNYTIVKGISRYDHIRKNTNKTLMPCLIEQEHQSSSLNSLFYKIKHLWYSKQKKDDRHMLFKRMFASELKPASYAIIKNFLKEEPDFTQLTRADQLKILYLAIRHKRTTVLAMRAATRRCLQSK